MVTHMIYPIVCVSVSSVSVRGGLEGCIDA